MRRLDRVQRLRQEILNLGLNENLYEFLLALSSAQETTIRALKHIDPQEIREDIND